MHFHRLIVPVLACAIAALGATDAWAASPKVHFTFDSTTDATGSFTGELCDGAKLEKLAGEGIVSLGDGGWFDMGSSVGSVVKNLSGDYTITTTVFIPLTTALGANGNFIFSCAKSSSTGYLFFGANESRYSITTTNWGGEQNNKVGERFPRGEWVSLAVVQSGDKNYVYFNGQLKNSADITLHPATVGETGKNWLGKSPYDGDVMLKDARYADFRIYDTALTEAEITEVADLDKIDRLNAEAVYAAIDDVVASMNFDFSDVRADIVLPTTLNSGTSAVWTSTNEALIRPDGKVTRPAAGQKDGSLELKMTATQGSQHRDYTFPATVRAMLTDAQAAQFDLDNLVLPPNKDNIRTTIQLPVVTREGSVISWSSGDPTYLSAGGRVLRQASGKEKKAVTLTAKATRNGVTATRDFTVYVAPAEDYDSYLFVYFPSNSNENLYYALSTDGYNYTALNNGSRVMASDSVAIKKGIRDPHILRGEDGKTFYMVATDMKSSEGWSSNRGMVLYKSTDLIHWQHSTVHFPTRFPEWKNVTRVWAPEVIWDANYTNTDGSKGRYMIYYSLLTNDGKCSYDKVYYSYANDDFTDLLTEPRYFYDRGSATIDCDIVYNEADGLYHMFYKNEGSGGICKVTASRLTPAEGEPDGSQWHNPSAQLQQTTEAVEGAGVFRLINSDRWVLMYDCYMNGHYQFCTSDDLENFRLTAQTQTKGAFTPRHGTVIALHPEETAALLKAFPTTLPEPAIGGATSPLVRTERLSLDDSEVYLPVKPGADLHSFDPLFIPTIGAEITPTGEQDFSAGQGVTYTVKCGSKSATYTVKAAVEANPVLPGFNADPEVLYSRKTGRFYLYPTTDGLSGWGGHTFNVWSSADLVNWSKENCILDLATNDVTWATDNAWAPSIEEVEENGAYRYYFYFSGQNPDKGYKTLGCAVADSPVGPFRDLGKPLVDTNITSGQLIDSDVFTDPVSGKTYFYWGNGNLVASCLTPDMTTVADAKVITPAGGTNSTWAFREGVYVFYRNGKYYFMWSVDDTGARNYHVAYGTSDSPMGPITVADDPIVIKQDSSNKIYGTGHNSVIQIPGRDEWYIVYHRINKDFINNSPGTHREVCIDRLEFNADGTIKPVTPTHTGIAAVDLSNTAIDRVEADLTDAAVKATFWYTAEGRYTGTAAPTASGIYIRVDLLDNGRTRAVKTAIR